MDLSMELEHYMAYLSLAQELGHADPTCRSAKLHLRL